MNRETCLENWPHAHVGEFDPRCCRFPKSCSIPDADDPIPAARTITEAEARILDAAKAYVGPDMKPDELLSIGGRDWWRDGQYGWLNDEDDPALSTEVAMLDEIVRLRTGAARTITEAEARILDAAKAYVEHCADDDARKAGHEAWNAMRTMRRAQMEWTAHQAYGADR